MSLPTRVTVGFRHPDLKFIDRLTNWHDKLLVLLLIALKGCSTVTGIQVLNQIGPHPSRLQMAPNVVGRPAEGLS